MSINITLPPLTNVSRIKQFFFDVKDRRNVERGIGGGANVDTTQVSTNSTTRVNLKSYTINAGAKINKARIRVYGYTSASVVPDATATVYVNVNGTDVASKSFTGGTSTSLVLDVFADLTSNASNTVKIDGYINSSSYTLYITKVVIIYGFSISSTTSTTILTVNLDPNNDVYTLKVSGNFVYKIGIRWWIVGNRKTSAQAVFNSNLANEIKSNTYNAKAGDDGDNSNVLFFIATGDYATSFTISGNVGASGDVIIITGVYAQIVLRGNNVDSYNTFGYWEILIKEKGLMTASSRHVTIDGSSISSQFYIITSNGYQKVYESSSGSDVNVQTPVFAINDSPEVAYHIGYHEDNVGFSLFLYVNIIILGV